MIINSIKANNVLKYAALELHDLPKEGIIAISGENESGKSTIGETICFALYGRTFSLGPDKLQKVIRWGEHQCSVYLNFSIEGQEYRLERFLDRDGSHSARLSRADDLENPIARGITSVQDRLFDLVGYEFDEFVESFYLAQREITTPHPHSVAVKTMAGVASLEAAVSSFEAEIDQLDEMKEEFQAEEESLTREMEDLNFQEGYLVELEDRKNALEAEIASDSSAVETLEAETDAYVENLPQIKRAMKKRGRAKFWRFLSFVAAAVMGGAWFMLAKKPDLAQSQQLLSLLQQKINGWQDAWIPYLGYGAIALAVIMLMFWIRAAHHAGVAKRLSAQSAGLVDALQKARAVAAYEGELPQVQSMAAADNGNEEDAATDDDAGLMDTSVVEEASRPDENSHNRLLSLVESADASTTETRNYVIAEAHWLRNQINAKEELAWAQEQEVEREMDRVRQVARLTEVIASLEEKIADIESKKEKRRKAIELLKGSIGYMSNNFNRDIRDLVARTLPIFTQGRYEHLRIDPDLTVRVFSSDKRDFMDLDEISSGTQRQIMLALRLALSQKLINRRVAGEQFAFLDEPFAFFDEFRTRYALKALSSLSDTLNQIWIVAQTYPEGTDVEFSCRLVCSRDIEVLTT